MATKIKTQFSKRVGHVPFHSSLTRDNTKGVFVVSGKHNGVEVVGTGSTERLAALDFQKQITDAAATGKTTTRG